MLTPNFLDGRLEEDPPTCCTTAAKLEISVTQVPYH